MASSRTNAMGARATRVEIARPRARRLARVPKHRGRRQRRENFCSFESRAKASNDEANEWYATRFVSSDGGELIRELKRIARCSARSFTFDGKNARERDVFDALISKTRNASGNFAIVVAERRRTTPMNVDDGDADDDDDDDDDDAIIGCADATRVRSYGKGSTNDASVASVPRALGLLESSSFVYVSGMCVAPEQRRKGVARALLASVERLCARMSPRPSAMALHVESDNVAARALYSRAGFVEIRERAKEDAVGRLGDAFARAARVGLRDKATKILMVKRVRSDDASEDDDDDG